MIEGGENPKTNIPEDEQELQIVQIEDSETVAPLLTEDSADSKIAEAFLESTRQQSILPLVKQELQYKIRYKRLSEGKEEFVYEEPKPTTYELTESERNKLEERRKQNRLSAYRSRKRSEDYERSLEKVKKVFGGKPKKIDEMTKANSSLTKERNQLRKTRDKLLLDFRRIGCVPSASGCSCGIKVKTKVETTRTKPE